MDESGIQATTALNESTARYDTFLLEKYFGTEGILARRRGQNQNR